MGRKKDAKKEAQNAANDAKERARELKGQALDLKDQAMEVAGHSSEALRDFAAKTKDAAKELVDAIEKAAKDVSVKPAPKKGRKVLKGTLAIGAGFAVLSNERAREAIRSVIARSKGETTQPEIWRPDAKPPASTNGGSASTTTAGIAEETS